MFNSEFFPCPSETIDLILAGESVRGKVCLEPQAGKADIVKRLKEEGANVIACEKNADLRKIVQHHCKVIADDFFNVTSEMISHVNFIIMNPPFSNADAHINHAWNIAPAGCRIISLCNSQTIRNPYSKGREELVATLEIHGQQQDLGKAFNTSERETDVDVILIRLQKPGVYDQEFSGFFMEEEIEDQSNGIMPYNVIRDLVNRYVASVKIFDEQLETAVRLNDLQNGYFSPGNDDRDRPLSISVSRDNIPLRRNEFKKEMQKSGWNFIFNKLNMKKYATRGLKEDINKFVESQQNVPFTMRNVYKMLEIVVGTNGQRMDKALMEVFDAVTRHTEDNRFNVEGWKTNSHYLMTKRFILPYIVTVGYSGEVTSATYGDRNMEVMEDMVKALCYVTGENYSDKPGLYNFIRYKYFLSKDDKFINNSAYDFDVKIASDKLDEIQRNQRAYPGSKVVETNIAWGQWFEWTYFRCRPYKKGTMHFEFKDEDVWGKFNQRIAKLKGYPLYESRKQTKYQKRQTGAKETVGMAG